MRSAFFSRIGLMYVHGVWKFWHGFEICLNIGLVILGFRVQSIFADLLPMRSA